MTTPITHPTPRIKHSELKEPDEILNKTKRHSQTEDSQRKALQWTSQTGKEPHKNRSEKNRALHNPKKKRNH